VSGHDLGFLPLTPTLSRWERELEEFAVNDRSKYTWGHDNKSSHKIAPDFGPSAIKPSSK
jgi:hypothetical protein